jgi:hypothetical protein
MILNLKTLQLIVNLLMILLTWLIGFNMFVWDINFQLRKLLHKNNIKELEKIWEKDPEVH